MKKKLDSRILYYLLVIFALLLLYSYFDNIIAAVQTFFRVIKPLLAGAMIAYILNIFIVRLERLIPIKAKEKMPKLIRGVSIIASILIVMAVIYLVVKLIVPQVVTMLTSLVNGIPTLITQIQDLLQSGDADSIIDFVGQNLITDFNDLTQRVINFATNSVNQLLSRFVQVIGGATSGLFSFVIAFSFSIYLLVSKEKLTQQFGIVGRTFLPEKLYRRIGNLLLLIHQTFTSFFVGQGLEAIILGTLVIVGMTLFRFPFAVPIGTFIGFTALIPMFGAWIGAGVGFILIATQSFTQGILFVIFIVILQQLENNLIYPRVVGTSIGIPGIWVLVAITIGGGVGGIAGMLLGVPIIATLYQLVKLITEKRMYQQKLMEGANNGK